MTRVCWTSDDLILNFEEMIAFEIAAVEEIVGLDQNHYEAETNAAGPCVLCFLD